MNIFFAKSLSEDLTSKVENRNKNIFFLWPMILFVLAFITIVDSFAEGAIDSWAALYMRDAILVEGFAIGLATIFFNIFMIIGRLIGDKIRDFIGRL